MDPPAPETLMRALEELNYLGALDDHCNLTKLGDQMTQFPIDPNLAKILLDSVARKCTGEILSIVSVLSVPNIFFRPRDLTKQADISKSKFTHPDGDHLSLLAAFEAFKYKNEDQNWCHENFINFRTMKAASSIRSQILQIMNNLGFKVELSAKRPKEYLNRIKKCILSGYFMQVAHQVKSGVYMTVKDNQTVTIHPSTSMEHLPDWVVYHEFVLTSKNFIRIITEINPKWLLEIAPDYYDLDAFANNEIKKKLVKARKKLLL